MIPLVIVSIDTEPTDVLTSLAAATVVNTPKPQNQAMRLLRRTSHMEIKHRSCVMGKVLKISHKSHIESQSQATNGHQATSKQQPMRIPQRDPTGSAQTQYQPAGTPHATHCAAHQNGSM